MPLPRTQATRTRAFAMTVALCAAGCGPSSPDGTRTDAATESPAGPAEARAFDREWDRLAAAADSFDTVLEPLPLMTSAQEVVLRRYLNPAQLDAARRLGVSPGTDAATLDRMVADGSLVRLPDSTDLWVIRSLDHSQPVLTRDAAEAVRRIASRFQTRLAGTGLPAFRIELTSLLRSAADQERLRAVNPNAAAGTSTHQYATTFDIAYNSFAHPAQPVHEPEIPEAPWLASRLERVDALMAGIIGARRAHELKRILAEVLIEMQNEGAIMVTIEDRQPVFHMTVSGRLEAR